MTVGTLERDRMHLIYQQVEFYWKVFNARGYSILSHELNFYHIEKGYGKPSIPNCICDFSWIISYLNLTHWPF